MSNANPKTSTPEPAYKQVANSIRRQILDGTFQPGDQFAAEGELAEQYSVSRSTVREALRLLTSEHLVFTRRGVTGGSFVAQPKAAQISESLLTSLDVLTSAKEISISELLEAREILEIPAAGLAAQRRNKEQVAAIEISLSDNSPDLSTFESGKNFHVLIMKASGNRLLETMTWPLFVVLRTRFPRDRAPESFWTRVNADHLAIYEAIAEGDRVTAEYKMRQHLQHIYEKADW
jgi:DNA-binding FadR family transcriptional regulator